jgi:hypothetical protein
MLDRWAVAGLLALLYSGTALGPLIGYTAAQLITIAPLVAFGYWTLFVRGALSARFRREVVAFHAGTSAQRWHWRAFLLFVAVFLASIARAGFTGAMSPASVVIELVKWLSILAVLFTVAIRSAASGDRSATLRSVSIAFGVLTVGNVLLTVAGVHNGGIVLPDPEPAVMLRSIGIQLTRTVLPLANGPGAGYVAAGLAIGVSAFRTGAVNRVAALVIAGATMACLLIADARGGLLGAVTGIAAAAAPSMVRLRLRWLAPITLALPILLVLAVDALSDFGFGQSLMRGGEASVGSLTGRPLVWSIIFISLSQFQLQHLVGFGASGQVASGVGLQYGFLFNYASGPGNAATAHNTLLQMVLDSGYLGAALYLYLSWRILSSLSTETGRGGDRARWAAVGSAALVSMLVLGATESTMIGLNMSHVVLYFALNLHSLSLGVAGATGPVREAGSLDGAAHDAE